MGSYLCYEFYFLKVSYFRSFCLLCDSLPSTKHHLWIHQNTEGISFHGTDIFRINNMLCHFKNYPLTSFIDGVSLCRYNWDNPFSTECTDTSLHSMYREICFPWKAIARERIVLESLLYGSKKLLDTVSELDEMSIVTKCSNRFKKNEILCLILGRSITKSASVEMDNFLRGLNNNKH